MCDSGRYVYAGSSAGVNFYLVEFVRKDTPDRDAILQAIQEQQAGANAAFSWKKLLLQQYVPWRN